MRHFLLPFLLVLASTLAVTPASAVTIDRVAAVVDRQVMTVSEVTQMVEIRFFPRVAASEDEHRRDVLEALITQMLRHRDVERFGAQDISRDAIDAKLLEIQSRFASEDEFLDAVARAELTLDEVRVLIRRQLHVEADIQERFAIRVFVSADDILEYYRGPWTEQRRERGLRIPPLEQVQDEVRLAVRSARLQDQIVRWTTQLRAKANVDIYAWR
jgi:parvulin-like peptidyl-prolyl isomerase